MSYSVFPPLSTGTYSAVVTDGNTDVNRRPKISKQKSTISVAAEANSTKKSFKVCSFTE